MSQDPDLFFMRNPLEWNRSTMFAIFGDLLPDSWDSPEYAATVEVPPRSVGKQEYYRDFPEVCISSSVKPHRK